MGPIEKIYRIRLLTIIGMCFMIGLYIKLKSVLEIEKPVWAGAGFMLFLEILAAVIIVALTLCIVFNLVIKQMFKVKHKQEEFEEMSNMLKHTTDELNKRNLLLQQKIEEISNLHNIIREMAQTMDLDKILNIILDSICRYLSFDRAIICLVDGKEGIVHGIQGLNVSIDALKTLRILLTDKENFIVKTVLEKRPMIVKDISSSGALFNLFSEIAHKNIIACVPLEAKGKVIGVLIADTIKTKRQLTEKDLRALLAFTNQAGLAIENARLYETEKKFKERLQEEINIAVKKLEEAQKQIIQSEKLAALGQMASVVTHEVRNPLATIRVSGELISSVIPQDNPNRKYVDYIIKEVDRLNRVVTDILSFSSIPRLSIKEVDINKLIDELCTFLEVSDFIKYDIKCYKEYDREIPVVAGDADQLKQVVLNIIQNACHFMANRGIRQLQIKTTKDNSNIYIKISDTGPGIPPENITKIFEPFFTTKTKGTGLGLAISKNIIEAHGGKITVETQLGVGSTFTISLPITPKGATE